MASESKDKKTKKPKRVSTVFNKQRVTVSPAEAKKIKSGEIAPETHTFSQKDGKVYFAPRKRAVVNGTGIMPTANTGQVGGAIPSARSGANPQATTMDGSNPQATTRRNENPQATTRRNENPQATTRRTVNPQATTTPRSNAQASANVSASNPSLSANTGMVNAVTPAQQMQMQEQQAARIAPLKQDITAITAEIESLNAAISSGAAIDDEQLEAIRTKLNAFKSAIPQQ